MAFAKHFYVAICGNWGSDVAGVHEVWQFGIRMDTGAPTGHWHPDPQGYANAIGNPIATWFAAATTGMANVARLQIVKVNNINPDGTYADNTTHQFVVGGAGTAGGKTIVEPGYNSLAWTWETDIGRGPGSRGRVYPPNPTFTLLNAFAIQTTDQTAQLTAAKALLNLLIAAQVGGVGVSPVVCSKTTGAVGTIKAVSVDNILDVQRRRKNRAVSARSRSVWP